MYFNLNERVALSTFQYYSESGAAYDFIGGTQVFSAPEPSSLLTVTIGLVCFPAIRRHTPWNPAGSLYGDGKILAATPTITCQAI